MNIIELESKKFVKIQPLFKNLNHLKFTFESVLAQNTPMRIWIDNIDLPKNCFMWDNSHCYYFVGNAKNSEFNLQIADLFHNRIIPEAISENNEIYKIEYSTTDWVPFLEQILEGINPISRSRKFFVLDELLVKDWRELLSDNLTISKIDENLLKSNMKNVDTIIDEIKECWPSIDKFLDKGFGFCAIVHLKTNYNEVQGWCTGEYFSKKKCGIGIETFENYQNKGVATAMASAFVEYALSMNIKLHWDAFSNNYASTRVAEKIGFRLIEEYEVFFGSYTEKNKQS